MDAEQMDALVAGLDFDGGQTPPAAEAGCEYFQGYSIAAPFANDLFDTGLIVDTYFTDWCHDQSNDSGIFGTTYGIDANRQVVPDQLSYVVTAENAGAWEVHWEAFHQVDFTPSLHTSDHTSAVLHRPVHSRNPCSRLPFANP